MYTVLFVDDNKNIREFCKRELEGAGYRVLLAGDGKEAVEALHREVPDLIVLDIFMPRMDGVSAARQVQAQYPEVPIIFYTANKDYLDRHQGWFPEACVEKSEDLAAMKSTIAHVLARSRRSGESNLIESPPDTRRIFEGRDPHHGFEAGV